MRKPLAVLLVEDSEDDALLLMHELRRAGFDPTSDRVETVPALRRALQSRRWDVVISDYAMPRLSGLAVPAIVREYHSDLPVILISGVPRDVEGVDVLPKDDMALLVEAIQRAIAHAAAGMPG